MTNNQIVQTVYTTYEFSLRGIIQTAETRRYILTV